MIMENLLRFPGFLARACTLSYDDGVRLIFTSFLNANTIIIFLT